MKRILFQGDSITDCSRVRATDENYGKSLGCGYAGLVAAALGTEFIGEYEFFNLGVGGNKILDIYNRMQQDIIDIAPDYMSIMVGVNDAINHLATNRFESLYQWLIEDVKAKLPNLKIMILSAFCDEWSERKFPGVNQDVTEKIAVTRKIAEKNNLVFIDCQEILDRALTKAPLGYWTIPDGIHPTMPLHQLLADAWVKNFKEKLL